MPKIVSLEGNIGAGKTTLLEKLIEQSNLGKKWVFLREPVDLWAEIKDATGETILSKFYADSAKYAFPFQVMAYATRLAELRRIIRENPDCDVVVCERSLEADKHIFAKMLHDEGKIEDVCYQIYHRFFEDSSKEFAVDALIYVDADASVCFDRIAHRARDGEGGIPLEYLEKCREYHEKWLNPNSGNTLLPILHLNTNETATFVNEDATELGTMWVHQMIEFIQKITE